ncbi:MAG TPA: DUF5947 family protein [Solirubrobacteraceae bacterium]|nr:DUF5947 family protein [Solirubrobacteraceae bacterium]
MSAASTPGTLAAPRLRRLAQRQPEARAGASDTQTRGGATSSPLAPADAQEHCELCNAPIPAVHRHMLELSSRELVCACRPCSVLFDRDGAGGGHYKLVPERRLRLDDFAIDDAAWEQLRIPVDMAFFFHSSAAERVLAYYPGPMGPTESQLQLSAWREIERSNPLLAGLEPDVEALLVNRVGDDHGHWLMPLDECYRLVGVIRMHWKGLSGGKQVWQEIERFFAELDRRARSATRSSRTARQKGA